MAQQKDVYVVDDCYVKIDGKKIPVSSFTLVTKHNGIPTLSIKIDPFHTISFSTSTKPKEASVKNMVDRYLKLQQIVNDKQKRESDFYFLVEVENPDGILDKQELDLKKWILTGVGFRSNAAGSMEMIATIKHPICKLTETTSNFFGYKGEERITPSEVEGSDVYDGIKKCMRAYHDEIQSNRVQPLQSDEDMNKMLKSYDDAIREGVEKHLKWEGPGTWPKIPWPTLGSEIPFTMWSYVNSAGDSTIWSWLSNTITTEYSTQILPNFWDEKLVLKPYRPWQPYDVEIKDSQIMDIELPASDAQPVRGIYDLFTTPESDSISVFITTEGKKEHLTDANIYSEKQDDKVPGLYYSLQTPAWVDMMLQHYHGRKTNTNEWSSMQNRHNTPFSSFTADPGIGEPELEKWKELRDGIKDMCKQQFTEFYRRMMVLRLSCNLMIQLKESKLPKQYVTAGYTYRLKPETKFWRRLTGGGGPLLDFFATDITHVVDCVNNQAFTQITGAYIREVPGGPAYVQAIPNGVAPNYLYEG